jgi:hypothetical protein
VKRRPDVMDHSLAQHAPGSVGGRQRAAWRRCRSVALAVLAASCVIWGLSIPWQAGCHSKSHVLWIADGVLGVLTSEVPISTKVYLEPNTPPYGLGFYLPVLTRLAKGTIYRIPIWMLIACAAVVAVGAHTRVTRTRPGTCAKCGYDLRGSGDRCPECGTDRSLNL